MVDSDVFAFQRVFNEIAAILPGGKKLEPSSSGVYFRALKTFSVEDVQQAADRWVAREKFFPKPAEWASACVSVPKGAQLLELSTDAAKAYADAEGRGFEAQPCTCSECVTAGVDEKPMRFVPTEDRFGEYEKRHYNGRTVLLGHWSHGAELARWYKGRAAFYEVAMRLKLGNHKHAESVLSLVGGAKEMP